MGVALQVNQFMVGQAVTQVDLDDTPVDVILRGRADAVNSIETIEAITISGPAGSAALGDVANVSIQEGPVSISRTDGVR